MNRKTDLPWQTDREGGGVALEYVLVTTFALATTLSALAYLGRTMKEKFAALEVAGNVDFDQEFSPVDVGP
ncbi:MAG: hypothetical protein RIQ81_1602 [Pseudomonadota bacterium]|jgi:hypothetical protein